MVWPAGAPLPEDSKAPKIERQEIKKPVQGKTYTQIVSGKLLQTNIKVIDLFKQVESELDAKDMQSVDKSTLDKLKTQCKSLVDEAAGAKEGTWLRSIWNFFHKDVVKELQVVQAQIDKTISRQGIDKKPAKEFVDNDILPCLTAALQSSAQKFYSVDGYDKLKITSDGNLHLTPSDWRKHERQFPGTKALGYEMTWDSAHPNRIILDQGTNHEKVVELDDQQTLSIQSAIALPNISASKKQVKKMLETARMDFQQETSTHDLILTTQDGRRWGLNRKEQSLTQIDETGKELHVPESQLSQLTLTDDEYRKLILDKAGRYNIDDHIKSSRQQKNT
ncbi:MAG TPA: hypothetical protein VN457_04785 [Chlamydiales bacterium]|nr:hypothetical protein [Chlamydiales bacterium]